MECNNGLCPYNYDGYCNNDEDAYYECEDQFWTADGEDEDEDEDVEDYAFADYDCECGLFGDE